MGHLPRGAGCRGRIDRRRTAGGVVPVEGEEDLLEARLVADDVLHAELERGTEDRIHLADDDARKVLPVDREVTDPRDGGEALGRDRLGEAQLEAADRATLEVGDLLHREEAALADDPD